MTRCATCGAACVHHAKALPKKGPWRNGYCNATSLFLISSFLTQHHLTPCQEKARAHFYAFFTTFASSTRPYTMSRKKVSTCFLLNAHCHPTSKQTTPTGVSLRRLPRTSRCQLTWRAPSLRYIELPGVFYAFLNSPHPLGQEHALRYRSQHLIQVAMGRQHGLLSCMMRNDLLF